MNKKLIIVAFFTSITLYANNDEIKTNLIRQEMAAHHNPNLTQDTHPTIYAMVKKLSDKAQIGMPKYITVYSAEYATVSDDGIVHKAVHDIKAYIDILGDLHICREILTTLPYNDIEGVLAVAIAEKSMKKPLKLATTGFATLAVFATALHLIDNYYNLGLGDRTRTLFKYRRENKVRTLFKWGRNYRDTKNVFDFTLFALLMPSLLTMKLHANNLQRVTDSHAIKLTDCQNVINGIKGLSKITDTYVKQNIFNRMISALKLRKAYDMLFYPVRSLSDEERIAYLMENII